MKGLVHLSKKDALHFSAASQTLSSTSDSSLLEREGPLDLVHSLEALLVTCAILALLRREQL